jgi:hypothetical protein
VMVVIFGGRGHRHVCMGAFPALARR